MPSVSPGRAIQGRSLGSYQHLNTCALVTRKSGELAILLPLCHDPASLAIPFADREWAGENNCAGDLALHCVSRNERDSHLAISLDRPNPVVARIVIGDWYDATVRRAERNDKSLDMFDALQLKGLSSLGLNR